MVIKQICSDMPKTTKATTFVAFQYILHKPIEIASSTHCFEDAFKGTFKLIILLKGQDCKTF